MQTDQPKPISEWTAERVAELYGSHFPFDCKQVAEMIKAALAAEQKKTDYERDKLDEVVKALAMTKEQLAAKGVQLEAWQQAFGTTQLTHAIARLEAAGKQLYAEREKVTLATQMVQIESKRANEAEQK